MIKCPKCTRPVDDQAETCYCCGYSIDIARKMFGTNLVQMPRLHDAAHCLRKQDRDDVSDVLDLLESRFPQLSFCAYLGALQPGVTLQELGFWLLNHVTVGGLEFSRPNENAVLLVLDVNTKQVGFSLGYFAEDLLDETDCHTVLQKARPYFMNADYGTALMVMYKKLARVLGRRARKIAKMPPEVQGDRRLKAQSLDVNPGIVGGRDGREERDTNQDLIESEAGDVRFAGAAPY